MLCYEVEESRGPPSPAEQKGLGFDVTWSLPRSYGVCCTARGEARRLRTFSEMDNSPSGTWYLIHVRGGNNTGA